MLNLFGYCPRQEIMEMLLTEKDSQIALMEITGAKTQYEIHRLNRLHSDRSQLNKRMKIEVIARNKIMNRNRLEKESFDFSLTTSPAHSSASFLADTKTE